MVKLRRAGLVLLLASLFLFAPVMQGTGYSAGQPVRASESPAAAADSLAQAQVLQLAARC